MSKPLRRSTAVVASAVLALSLSACTAGQWVYDSPPAAGAQADSQTGIKLRNFAVVADGEGAGMIVGGITSRDADAEVVGITVAGERGDATFGEAQTLPFSEDIVRGRTILLDGSSTLFDNDDLTLDRLAKVQVAFADGQSVSLEVPVISSTNDDFKDAWAAANA